MELGTDIVEIARIEQILRRFPKVKARLFTGGEIAYCEKRMRSAQHYAVRFAAKESVMKALGGKGRPGIRFCDIEIVLDQAGKPRVRLHGRARLLKEKLGCIELKISLSHCHSYAVATALLVGAEKIDIIE